MGECLIKRVLVREAKKRVITPTYANDLYMYEILPVAAKGLQITAKPNQGPYLIDITADDGSLTAVKQSSNYKHMWIDGDLYVPTGSRTYNAEYVTNVLSSGDPVDITSAPIPNYVMFTSGSISGNILTLNYETPTLITDVQEG